MGILDKITNAINPFETVLKGAQDIIGKFKLDPGAKKELELEFRRLEAKAISEQREYETRLEEAYLKDAASLRAQAKIELQSEDWFVRRARPSWMWGLLVIYMTCYAVVPLVSLFSSMWAGSELVYKPVPLPYEVHALVGCLVVGYGYFRSIDKAGAKPPFSR